MSTQSAVAYAEWLREKMDERGLSQRGLATRINPNNPEVARRSVRRYLKGMVPLQRTRVVIADALGTEDLGPDAADSEDD